MERRLEKGASEVAFMKLVISGSGTVDALFIYNMKIWIKENWFKLGILIVILIVAYLLLGNQNKEVFIPKVGGLDFNYPLEKNKELEEVYKNNKLLPAHHTVCIPTKKYSCDFTGCDEVEPTVFNLLGGNRANSNISRCDKNPCDTYSSEFDDSGDFKVIQAKSPRGFLFKMSYNTIDKKYVEVATLGLDTFISYGYCRYLK